MKLLYVTSIFPFGNWETFFRPEVRSLSKADDVMVVATRPQQADVFFPGLGIRPKLVYNWRLGTFGLALREFTRSPLAVISAFGSIVMPQYRLAAKLKNVSLFPKALALAQIARDERIEHIHAQWITTPATLAFVASRLTGIPWSITAHQHDIFSDNMLTQKVRSARFTRVISARNCRFLREFIAGDVKSKCVVVFLGVDIPPTVAMPPPRVVPKLVCGARFGVWKGHTVLIDALAELRRRNVAFQCDFAGDGELRQQVESAIARTGLGDSIRLLGTVEHSKLLASMSAGEYDCFVLASTEAPGEHEGIPIAIMEAMAAGLPVVSTRTGSIDELVTPQTGSLVEQRDPIALADALEPYLRDPELRFAVGARAREHVRAKFSTEATTDMLRAYIGATMPIAQTYPPVGDALKSPPVYG